MNSAGPRILGVDPGSTITGFAIIDGGAKPTAQRVDCIRLPSADFPTRLGVIFERLSAIIAEFAPDELAIEDVFVARNAASALKLGQARGAAICAGASVGMHVAEYSPTQIKQAVVGRGHAQKQQVQHMVSLLLGLTTPPQADAADAAAVALCHAHHAQTEARSVYAHVAAGRA
ncbi:crossover junction endodeoxyribonuclease RuvC [Salinisphaera sp. USBA-960]|uniref:crossover junction endodeoxyribonuclease RuvC n=1 Tax=Salinisphaera orenii TaxID=856731 RepID=UPI000DBE3CD7|nr:crossover junction endodeoxyribonuclease RuvC [Salifodinibacter halophilus]NNC25985.1 crossover junction endodeoxyribonuclease RuvC [Salifodinibacter halophilus]